ncbi:MAG: glycosyltransferase family 2 protein [Acidobacteriia bacterium]|nr:glycosyltransferase family 2 protein [Terriglobia bacterium]
MTKTMRLPLALAIAVLGVFDATSASQDARPYDGTHPLPARDTRARPPQALQVHVDLTAPAMTGRTIAVPGDGDLNAALAAARPGDTIALEAGAVYEGPFTLPAKSGPGAIVITTDAPAVDLPPAGSRIDPSYADLMPALTARDPGPVVIIPAGVAGYRFVGVEIRPEPGQFLTNLVLIGGWSRDLAPPANIVFDRCYLHGDPVKGSRRGVAMNGGATAVINSYLSDFKEVGSDSQAIAGWDGPGPFAIVNNHLEAAGENLLFGGADPSTVNLVPADIEIRHNHFVKPLSWKADDRTYAGTPWTVKNLFELKNAERVLVDGNVFEYNWPAAQNGFAVLFTVRNQDGHAPWSTVGDVVFSNNIVRHAASGLNVLGRDDIRPSGPTRRILVSNNLFDDIGGAWGNGRLFQLLNGTSDVVFDHNTAAAQTDSFLQAGDTIAHLRFVFRNNIVPHNLYGVIGGDAGFGVASIDRYFPDSIFQGNVIIGGAVDRYPLGNFFPASPAGVGFADWGGHDFRLISVSPFLHAGTDGRAPGVDLAALIGAAQGADVLKPRPEPTAPHPPRARRSGAGTLHGAQARAARALFWASAGILIYTYAGYPLLIVAWARIRPRPGRRRRVEPSVSILVIAHNEGDAIAAKIDNLLALDYPEPRLDVVIASDGSTDDTAAIARAADSPRVHVFSFARRRGKAAVLNDLVPRLTGDIVVLADTRQRIEAGALWALVAPFADPRVGAVSGELMLNDGAGAAAGRGVSWYWRYEKVIRQSESDVDSTIGATGAVYAIRRALFERIPPDTILDDVLIPLRIARRGCRILFEPGARAFDRVAPSARAELERKVRTSAGNFQLLARERWLWSPLRNRLWFQTVSHKGLRLLLPPLHLAALAAAVWLSARAPFYRAMADLQILFYAAALGGVLARGRRGRIARLLALPYVICLLNWATLAGFVRFLRGLQPAAWQPTHVSSAPSGGVVHLGHGH